MTVKVRILTSNLTRPARPARSRRRRPGHAGTNPATRGDHNETTMTHPAGAGSESRSGAGTSTTGRPPPTSPPGADSTIPTPHTPALPEFPSRELLPTMVFDLHSGARAGTSVADRGDTQMCAESSAARCDQFVTLSRRVGRGNNRAPTGPKVERTRTADRPGGVTNEASGLGAPSTRNLDGGVGEGGVEPPRPFGHTDLNRARLPFRHSPQQPDEPSTEPRRRGDRCTTTDTI